MALKHDKKTINLKNSTRPPESVLVKKGGGEVWGTIQ